MVLEVWEKWEECLHHLKRNMTIWVNVNCNVADLASEKKKEKENLQR